MDLLMELKVYRMAKIVLVFLLLIGIIVLFAAIAARTASDSNPLKQVTGWKIHKVETSDTRVYCLARRVANNRFDITGVSTMIAEKNHLKDYNLYQGQEILMPVFAKKK